MTVAVCGDAAIAAPLVTVKLSSKSSLPSKITSSMIGTDTSLSAVSPSVQFTVPGVGAPRSARSVVKSVIDRSTVTAPEPVPSRRSVRSAEPSASLTSKVAAVKAMVSGIATGSENSEVLLAGPGMVLPGGLGSPAPGSVGARSVTVAVNLRPRVSPAEVEKVPLA